MYTEEFWAEVRQIWQDAFNKGDLDGLDQITSVDYVRRMTPFKDVIGLNGVKQYIENTRLNYPDCQLIFDEYMVDEEGRMVTEWTFKGTRSGLSPTTGEARTEKCVSFRGSNIELFEDGKLVETRVYGDWLTFLQQLDIVPDLG